jgi:hypothetical protein
LWRNRREDRFGLPRQQLCPILPVESNAKCPEHLRRFRQSSVEKDCRNACFCLLGLVQLYVVRADRAVVEDKVRVQGCHLIGYILSTSQHRHGRRVDAPLVSKMLIQVFTPASAAMAAFGESCRRR